MPRIKFTRPRKTKEEPLVSIRQGRFHFNAFFARVAELEKAKYVTYHLDDENREVAFEFLKDSSDDNAYRLENRGGLAKFRCAAQDLIAKKPWVRHSARASDPQLRSFNATRDSKLWVIRLTPSFEEEILRPNASKVPAETSGIYRYLAEDGEVVYIGKGNVRQRLSEPERHDWKFAKIQYSVLRDESDQYRWENFWLEHYSEANNGRLPYYNRQGGNKT
jgi:hypothetical protein